MKVALYARVSRHDKDQNPENQLIKLREFASCHGWEKYAAYVDYASGAKTSRPGFDKMLKDARARRFDAILIVRIDRLARSTRHLLNVLEDLSMRGVELVCTDQEIDTTTPAGKLLFTVLGAVSELELDLIRERTKDGLVRARAEGKRLGRPPSSALTEHILELREEGMSLREIGNSVGLSHQAVKQRLRAIGYRNGHEKGRGPGGEMKSSRKGATLSDDNFTASCVLPPSEGANAQSKKRRRSVGRKRGARSMGRYPFLTVGMQYLEKRKPFLAKSTVDDLERKVYLINAVLTELRRRGAVRTTNPGKMVQEDIGAFVKHMETEKPMEGAGTNGRKKGQRVKTASRNYLVGLLHLLKKVCAFAGNNVFTQMEVQGDPIPRKLPKDLSSLNDRELARIAAAAKEMEGWRGEVAQFIVAIYPYTGVRYNELRLAHIEDIDTEEWTIFVRHPKGEKRYARQRTAPILPPAREAVLRFLEARDQRLKVKGVNQTEALIPAWHNGCFDFYSYTNLRQIKNEVEERASRDGKPLKFHIKTFRDTYAQMNIDRDPSLLSQVSVTVGHATTRTTEESYGRISMKRSVSDLNRSWEAVQVPRCKKPLIDEKVGMTG